jgi:seryl-tRNA synthetase
MLDIGLIRDAPEKVAEALAKRDVYVDFTEILALDGARRELIRGGEQLKARRNQVSGDIPRLRKQGADVESLILEMKETGDRIRESDAALAETEARLMALLEVLPNTPAPEVCGGGKENNEVLSVFGEKPAFPFEPKDHVELCTKLGLIDYERGVKLGGSGFWMYRGDGALLEWALINYFIEEHRKDGYEFILPPHILTYQCGYAAGQFPKFEEDVFTLTKNEGRGYSQFMLPTAETALVNIHRDETIDEGDLPKKYFAFTPCYRSEAGGARSDERGTIRGHQFNKVEMVQYTAPENSEDAFSELVGKAERLVRALGLHHRVSKLAAGDCGAAMAKTYDIEVWLPSVGIYKEVSSVSTSKDYQARRGNMRVRRKESRRNEYLHTLNASGLATSRIFPAIVEQFQCADGGVKVPEVLQKWVGKEFLR